MNTELRVEIRTTDDGYTRALLALPGRGQATLAVVPAQAYVASVDVQAAFIALTKAVFAQILAEAVPGATIGTVAVVAPGAPLDAPKH